MWFLHAIPSCCSAKWSSFFTQILQLWRGSYSIVGIEVGAIVGGIVFVASFSVISNEVSCMHAVPVHLQRLRILHVS